MTEKENLQVRANYIPKKENTMVNSLGRLETAGDIQCTQNYFGKASVN
jgi:hypothetical protein